MPGAAGASNVCAGFWVGSMWYFVEEEMLYWIENDDLDYWNIDVASDAGSNNHVSNQEEVDDHIYASNDEDRWYPLVYKIYK